MPDPSGYYSGIEHDQFWAGAEWAARQLGGVYCHDCEAFYGPGSVHANLGQLASARSDAGEAS